MSLFRRNRAEPGATAFKRLPNVGLSHGRRTQATLAARFDDFMQATPYVRRAARQACAPVAFEEVGHLLARFNHGGSGPGTGGLILARTDGHVTGFALLVPDRQGAIQIAWLHADVEWREEAVEALWRAVARTTATWNAGKVHIGAYVPLPPRFGLAAPTASAMQEGPNVVQF